MYVVLKCFLILKRGEDRKNLRFIFYADMALKTSKFDLLKKDLCVFGRVDLSFTAACLIKQLTHFHTNSERVVIPLV